MAHLDKRFRDAHVAQIAALATLGVAMTEANAQRDALRSAEVACEDAMAAREAADAAAYERASDTARARRDRIDRSRALAQWSATEQDAKAVATSVGGFGRAIAGATGQAIMDGLGGFFSPG